MKPYKSKSGKQSGVVAYQAADESITVRFTTGMVYTYSYHSAGKRVVEVMKKLAAASEGLSTYISQHDPAYD